MGTGARDHLEGFDPSCGRLDDVAVPEVLKVLAESVEKVWIVVNDEDPGLLVCHWNIPRRRLKSQAVPSRRRRS